MQITKPKLSYTVCDKSADALPVIIVSAGASSRMGGINKQFLPLCGMPVIARTLRAFENSPFISRIILVARDEDIPDMQLIAQKYGIEKLTDIVAGGKDRRASVFCGIERLESGEERVLIHDGARPFVEERMIGDCVEALKKYDACLCGVRINDTVKRADENGIVSATVDRAGLYAAQTPQGVWVAGYREAAAKAPDIAVTDDASLMEVAGYKVCIVSGSSTNIKITTPEDVEFAEILIKGREQCG